MPLVIIESPNKIRKLSKILGSSYTIKATKGHVMDLPGKKLGVDIKSGFTPTYEVSRGAGKIIKEITEAAKKHDVIYLATDPDREGEAIAAHILTKLPKRGKTIHRVRFHAITKKAVEDAIASPGTLDTNLYDAQQARRVTDRLVGYQVSPIMWRKGIKGASAGRVQSVALRYVVDREREIEAFDSEEYWEIDADTDLGFKARMWGISGKKKTIRQGVHAAGIKKSILDSGRQLKVVSVKRKNRTRKPDAPFITSTLQQAANNILGWSVDKTMKIAQDIFSKGIITYHRTDSTVIDKEYMAANREHIAESHTKGFLAASENSWKSKKASQEAHEAIRPTGEDAGGLKEDEHKLFDLIRRRFIASQMANAQFEQLSVELESVDTKLPVNFRVNGSKRLFEGFLKVYGSTSEDVILPDLKEGQVIGVNDLLTAQKFTQPPGRYSDASLVKKMESDGVGRPATYAAILGTLRKREFVVKEGRSFKATDLGKLVYDYMQKFFPQLVDPTFTAQMETRLDEVAAGITAYADNLQQFYEPFEGWLSEAKKGDIKDLLRTEYPCPVCDGGFFLKRPDKEGGNWYSCENYPDCKTVAKLGDEGIPQLGADGKIRIKEDPKEEDIEKGPDCPRCGAYTVKRKGRYGDFYGCSAWRKTKCKGIINIDKNTGEAKKREIYVGVTCKNCGDHMEKLDGRYGVYLRCVQHPDCKTNMPIPLGLCPDDKGYVVERYSKKKKSKFYACMNYPDCEFACDSMNDFDPLPDNTIKAVI